MAEKHCCEGLSDERHYCDDFAKLRHLLEKSNETTEEQAGKTEYKYATDRADFAYNDALDLAKKMLEANKDDAKTLFRLRDLLRTKGPHATDLICQGGNTEGCTESIK
ncbi:hypothetical protein JXA56_05080 [Candidatus Micrarchaeota archaeon]|nr:hypothetical protein [Candidatus Micrarchaeota archaeon]